MKISQFEYSKASEEAKEIAVSLHPLTDDDIKIAIFKIDLIIFIF